MTDEQRKQWAAINAIINPPKPAEELPLPAATPRAKMDLATQEKAFENWVSHINAKPTQTWTPEETNAVRVASIRALKGMGY
jgi:hypothetical protein